MAASAIASVQEWKAAFNRADPLGSLEPRPPEGHSPPEIRFISAASPLTSATEPIQVPVASAHTGSTAAGIVDFLGPGDLFGYDAQDAHSFSSEAISLWHHGRCAGDKKRATVVQRLSPPRRMNERPAHRSQIDLLGPKNPRFAGCRRARMRTCDRHR